MRETRRRQPPAALIRYAVGVAALAFGLGPRPPNLTNQRGGREAATAVSGFKYIVQEDTTYLVDPPSRHPPARADMLSFNFHASNHPVRATGNADGSSITLNNVDGSADDPRPLLRLGAALLRATA